MSSSFVPRRSARLAALRDKANATPAKKPTEVHILSTSKENPVATAVISLVTTPAPTAKNPITFIPVPNLGLVRR